MKENLKELLPQPLGGEAEKDSYFLLDENKVSRTDVIFPILKEIIKEEWEFIGTGFFIIKHGVFVSAKHVFMDVIDENKHQKYPIFILQKLPDKKVIKRYIIQCSTHESSDIGIGVLGQLNVDSTGELLENKIVTLTTIPPKIGETIVTYAFPRYKKKKVDDGFEYLFMPDFYDGKLEEYYINGRDSSNLPAPCYRTTINIHGGASGGPVFSPAGHVFGVNSTSFSLAPDISFVSRINEILSLRLNNVLLPNSLKPESTTIFELAKIGCVKFEPFSCMMQSRNKNGILLYSY